MVWVKLMVLFLLLFCFPFSFFLVFALTSIDNKKEEIKNIRLEYWSNEYIIKDILSTDIEKI